MDTVKKPKTARLLNPANAQLNGQARVNAEIFTAVEILGHKLERSEAERDRLVRRLALIESAATVDEATGRLYLPVVMDSAPEQRKAEVFSPKGMATFALISSMVTLFVLGIMMFHAPTPSLTKDQLATLDSLKGSQFALLSPESKEWKNLDGNEEEKQQEIAFVASVQPVTTASVPPVPNVSVPLEPITVVATKTPPEMPKLVELPVVEEMPPAPLMTVVALVNKPVVEPVMDKVEEVIKVDIPPVTIVKKEEVPSVIIENNVTKVAKVTKVAEQVIPPAPSQKELIKPSSPSVVIANTADDTTSIKPDPALPEKLAQLEKRAYQGIPEAEHDMATLYASGKLVAQNYDRAIYWFTRAANGGIANAHYNLGVIYHQGMGVKADVQKALVWYERAAELGHPEAIYNLGIAYVEGIGTDTNIAKGVSYFKRAASSGVAQAAYNLGVLYESNFIGAIDLDKASEWYQEASDSGHSDARIAFNRLNGTEDQALTLADMVEPAAGGEEYGEGDSSPVEVKKAKPAPERTAQANEVDLSIPPKHKMRVEEGEGEVKAVPELTAKNYLLYKIQLELLKQGLFSGKADGVMSKWTERAIRTYQKRIGLPEDGLPSKSLLGKTYHTVNR